MYIIAEKKSKGGELSAQSTVHHDIISFNKKIAEVGLTHGSCPLCQNGVIIHSLHNVCAN
jgi:hypothetical protein